jgi:hypothetical protein
MEVTFTPSVVLTYSARRRSGLSFPDLIFTKLVVDFYLSMTYVSRLQKGAASWSFTATVPPPQLPLGLRRNRRKRPAERAELDVRPSSSAGSAGNPAPSKPKNP